MEIREKNMNKLCRNTLLIIICILAGVLFMDISVRAESTRIGTVYGLVNSTLRFRSGPGTSYGVITALNNGDQGTILGEQKATNGIVWYQMNVNGTVGWASSEFIQVSIVNDSLDGDFESYLNAQGFPESYKQKLRALHSQYPNWIFEAQHTNLNWNDVIAGESVLGKNLVHSSSIASWKSIQNGAYNWQTGQWTEFDTGGWVMASGEMIQYCMDPRNFLNSTDIFQFVKHSYNVSTMGEAQIEQKKADLTSMVSGTYLAGNCDERSYVDVIMDVAAETKVCPLILASMMIQEQGSDGHGRSISGTVPGYEGYYNYFNIGAYVSEGMTAVQRGLWYAKGSGKDETSYVRPWNTRTASIKGGAIYYGERYVYVGQDTLYLKKFNVQGSNIYGHQYMTNVQGAISEGKHVAEGYDENARKAAIVFKIPVYQNMPATPCAKPTGNTPPMGWIQDDTGWWYLNPDKTYPCNQWKLIGGVWYHFDSRGYMETGWLNLGGTWYYLRANGAMATGWLNLGGKWYYLNESGAMVTGWLNLEGTRYYLDGSGVMATGWTQIGDKKYYFDESGAMKTGWTQIGSAKYYFKEDGAAATGWLKIKGIWYYFDGNGAMATGWLNLGGTRYYLNESGEMATGWTRIEDKQYYFDENGAMKTSWTQIGNVKYYFDENGVLATSWAQIGDKEYYLDGSGKVVTGWIQVGNAKYYLNVNGAKATGWLNLGGTWYYLKADGAMATGWIQVGNAKYYLKEDGTMITGWLNLGGTWYYFNGSGAMVTGWLNLSGTWYYLNADGTMAMGWLNLGGTWYYLRGNGAMATGWLNLGGTWYYLHGNGAMATGWLNLGGTWYYLRENGAMATGWLNLGGTWYYLLGSGAMATGWLNLGGTWYYLQGSGAMATGRLKIGNKWYQFSASGAMQ